METLGTNMVDPSDIFAACQIPCYVLLKRLSEEEIQKHLSVIDENLLWDGSDKPERTQKKIANHYLRNVSRVDFGLFAQYKRSREKFLNRKARRSSIEMADFGEFSNDELGGLSNEEEYLPDEPFNSKRKRKRAYEDDTDWSPNLDARTAPPLRPRRTQRSLRVNTRRKRIESDSSNSGDDDFYFGEEYETKSISKSENVGWENSFNSLPSAEIYSENKLQGDVLKESEVPNLTETRPIDGLSSSLLDNDVLSKIMQEMEDFNMKNRKKGTKSQKFGETGKMSFHSNARTNPTRSKKRQSRVIKITDDLTPSLRHVQEILKNMVNTVCSFEEDRKTVITESRKKKCKWCEIMFSSNSETDILCKICNDVVKMSSLKNSSTRRPSVRKEKSLVKPSVKAGAVKSKIKKKLLNNLPKSEQQRLMYGDKFDKSSVEKGYNHCKSFVTLKDGPSNDLIATTGTSEKPSKIVKVKKKVKVKKNVNITDIPTLMIKKKKKVLESVPVENLRTLKPKLPPNTQILNLTEESKKHVSVKSVDKGLFLIDFPEPHHGLTDVPVSKPAFANAQNTQLEKDNQKSNNTPSQNHLTINQAKQPVANSVQYGTYLLPPVPTVVVANYAATDAKNGDYYLSSVYYQNEMTQSKNAAGRNEIVPSNFLASNSTNLPSMPSMEQLSNLQMGNASTLAPAYQLDSLPGVNSTFSISNSMVNNAALVNQQMASAYNPCAATHPTEQNFPQIVNSQQLQTEPVQYGNSQILPDLAKLLSNPQLQLSNPQLQPKPSVISGTIPCNTFKNNKLEAEVPFAGDNIVENSLLVKGVNKHNLGLPLEEPAISNVFSEIQTDTPVNQVSELLAKSSDNNQYSNMINDSNANILEYTQDSNHVLPELGPQSGENAVPTDTDKLSTDALFRKANAELDAICVLGVVDLDKNPKWSLERFIDGNKTEYEKLKTINPLNKDAEAKLKHCADNGSTLQLAKTLLSTFGSFTKLSNSCLRHAKLLEIKKEKIEEDETRSSCQFAQSQSIPPFTSDIAQPRNADRLAAPINHIEKIQTQINSMPTNTTLTDEAAQLGIVHSFPVPYLSTSVPSMSTTPRSEFLNESRETPSRGSGPRTPARPESAMSQPEEHVLTPLQIKREKVEASSSPLSQCSYSQITPSPQLTLTNLLQNSTPTNNQVSTFSTAVNNQVPTFSTAVNNQVPTFSTAVNNQVPTFSTAVNNQLPTFSPSVNNQLPTYSAAVNNQTSTLNNSLPNTSQVVNTQRFQFQNIVPNVTISNTPQIQNILQFQNRGAVPPNVTAPFNSNPNFSKVLLNIASKQQMPPNTGNMNPNNNVLVRGGQVYNVRQVIIPSNPGLQQRFNIQHANPSMNQLNILRQNPISVPNTVGGTVLVNNIRQQNTYSLQNTVQRPPVSIPQQISSVSLQQAIQQIQSNSENQASPSGGFLMQNNNNKQTSDDSGVQMFCALCNNPATLRCKQCAKIAYCGTKCAKTYWHSKHKTECKLMSG